jgi:cysteine desulfurase
MDIDVVDWGVDAASFSSHKIYGPKGIGALFLSAAAPWRPVPLLFGGGQEQGLRPGTLPTPLCAGFAEAFAIIAAEGAHERQRVKELRDGFARQLSEQILTFQPTVLPPQCHPGNLHARFIGIEADDLLARIQPQVSAATGSACSSGQIHGSHVLEAIGLSQSEASEGLRLSIGRFSNVNELAQAVSLIAAAIAEITQLTQADIS